MKRFVVGMAVAVVAASAAPARELSAIPGVQVVPLRVAQVYRDGSFGPWIDYVQSRDLLSDTLVFDRAEPDVDGRVSGIVGAPIGFGLCGLGEPEDPSGNR